MSIARRVSIDHPRIGLGRAFALVAASAGPDRTWRFEEGLVAGPTGCGLEPVAMLILSVVAGQTDVTVVGESFNSRPHDRSTQGWNIPMLLLGEEVFPAISGAEVTADKVLEVIDYLDGLQRSLLFVTAGAPRVRGTERVTIDATDVEAMASGVKLIVATAYDGEGFVIWTPESDAEWSRKTYGC